MTTQVRMVVDKTVVDMSPEDYQRNFTPPPFTTTQRDALVAPTTGMMIRNTTTSKLNWYTGAAWEAITSA